MRRTMQTFSQILLLYFLLASFDVTSSENGKVSLSRRKRYVVFPEGSTLSVSNVYTRKFHFIIVIH